MPPKTRVRIKIAVMVTGVVAVCCVAGCAKKSGREAVPETRYTLSVTSDTRDGKTYKTVTIGKQTWMAKNLNYATSSGSWCYENDPSNCDKYGRLYDWNTAMSVCPTGWHLPTRQDWGELAKIAGGIGDYGAGGTGGKKLQSKTGWYQYHGTDDFGFSALPGGYRYSNGLFVNDGKGGYWWTATEDSGSGAYGRDMYYYDPNMDESDNSKSGGFSVRCVKDVTPSGKGTAP